MRLRHLKQVAIIGLLACIAPLATSETEHSFGAGYFLWVEPDIEDSTTTTSTISYIGPPQFGGIELSYRGLFDNLAVRASVGVGTQGPGLSISNSRGEVIGIEEEIRAKSLAGVGLYYQLSSRISLGITYERFQISQEIVGIPVEFETSGRSGMLVFHDDDRDNELSIQFSGEVIIFRYSYYFQ